MGWLSGVLSGYSDRQGEIRRENAARAEQAAQREGKIYDALLNSKDEELRNMAATGIMQLGQPRRTKGGFAGWMGEMETSPIYPVIQKYMSTPKRVETITPGLPSVQGQGFSSLPGLPSGRQSEAFAYPVPPSATQLPEEDAGTTETDPNSLAQPATTPTQGGPMATPQPQAAATTPPPAPPPSAFNEAEAQPPADAAGAPAAAPTAAAAPAAAPAAPLASSTPAALAATPPPAPPASMFTTRQVAGPAVGRTDVSYETPHFPTAEEQATDLALSKERAEYLALVEAGRRSGQPNPEKWAADLIAQDKMRARGAGSATPFQFIPGETTLPDGTRKQVWAAGNKGTGKFQDAAGNQFDNFTPRSAVALGMYFEQAAIEAGYARGSMVPPEAFEAVENRAYDLRRRGSEAGGLGTRQGAFKGPIGVQEAQNTGTQVGASSEDYAAGTTPPKPPTEAQRTGRAYHERMQEAVDEITKAPGPGEMSLEDRIVAQSLLQQFQGQGYVPSVLQTPDQRRYRQAQRAFTEARLRRESGAAVPLHEVENDAKVYFAQPGDDADTLAQKARARARVIDSLKTAVSPVETTPPPGKGPPPPPAVTTNGAAGSGRTPAGGGTTTTPGRIDTNSDIIYGPDGATVVGR